MKVNVETIKRIVFILVIYCVYTYIFKGYIAYLPTLPIYPNNKDEIKKMKIIIKQRTQDDIRFFYLTNESVSKGFLELPFVKETREELDNMAISQNSIIKLFKYSINRRRPWQEDKEIKPINIETAQTPAYPAGHAYQAYYMCKILSKRYPDKKQELNKMAMRCDKCRIQAGLHYPSDGEFSKKLVNFFNK